VAGGIVRRRVGPLDAGQGIGPAPYLPPGGGHQGAGGDEGGRSPLDRTRHDHEDGEEEPACGWSPGDVCCRDAAGRVDRCPHRPHQGPGPGPRCPDEGGGHARDPPLPGRGRGDPRHRVEGRGGPAWGRGGAGLLPPRTDEGVGPPLPAGEFPRPGRSGGLRAAAVHPP